MVGCRGWRQFKGSSKGSCKKIVIKKRYPSQFGEFKLGLIKSQKFESCKINFKSILKTLDELAKQTKTQTIPRKPYLIKSTNIHIKIAMLKANRRLEATEAPIVERDNGKVTSVTCEDSFVATRILINPDPELWYDLDDPILSNITVQFDYDAYFIPETKSNEAAAIEEVSNEIFLHVINKSPLMLDNSSSVVVTNKTCDALLENTIRSMITFRSGRQLRRLNDLEAKEWDYYLGWNSQADIIHSGECDSPLLSLGEKHCKTITSSLTAQVPTDRQLNEMGVKLEILQHIRDGFEDTKFSTASVHNLTFTGMHGSLSEGPTDVIDDNKPHGGEVTEEPSTGVLSAFGVSATALLGVLTLLTCGVFGYKIKGRKPLVRQASFNEEDLVHCEEQELTQGTQVKEAAQAVYTHSCSDGVELVHIGEKDGNQLNHQEGDIQTGFNGLSLSAWMESLRNDNDSYCGFSNLDKVEDEEELLADDESNDGTEDDEHDGEAVAAEGGSVEGSENGALSLGYLSEDGANTIDTGLHTGQETVRAENRTKSFRGILEISKRNRKK